MKDKITKSIALAVLAAVSIGTAANADGGFGCAPKKTHKRVARRVAAKPELIKETKITTTKTIEKPIVIEQEPAKVVTEPVCAPKCEAPAAVITQPAVCETATPVVIDRYVRRHRSLIHLGLFPFNLFGN